MVVSTSEWPLVVTRIRDGYTLDDIHALNESFDAILAREEPFAALTDALGMRGTPSRIQRAAIAEWNHENEARIRRFNVAGSIAIDSALARAALRAIQWIAPHPSPYLVCATVEEAREFCLAHLTAQRVA